MKVAHDIAQAVPSRGLIDELQPKRSFEFSTTSSKVGYLIGVAFFQFGVLGRNFVGLGNTWIRSHKYEEVGSKTHLLVMGLSLIHI